MQAGKKSKYHHGDLRKALIDVAVSVIDEQGIDALNLRGLALAAGVSSGAPYHHFAGRTELLAAIAQEGFEMLEKAMIEEGASSTGDSSARLAALGRAYVMFATSHPGYFRVMFRGELYNKAVSGPTFAGDRAFQLLCEAIEACQRADTAPKGDPKPWVLHAWAMVHGLATLLVDGGLSRAGIPLDQLVPLMTRLTSQLFGAMAVADAAKRLETNSD
jgi:AcrR family transcriptional regulator